MPSQSPSPLSELPISRPSAAPRAEGPRTWAEEIRARLADDIVRGRRAPGVPLEEEEIARQFGVSRTPVREAIRQLEAIGLVVARPHRGAAVAEMTLERLDEMFTVLGELEAVCARECAIRMTPGERRRLEALHQEMSEGVNRGALDGYAQLNEQFHEMVTSSCHNAFLAEMTASVRVRLAPFRKAQFHASLQRLAHSWAEHDRVVQAILQGDGSRAAQTMRDHIRTSRRSFDAVAPRAFAER
jgi:DNA-binding GntR family transcriptional regulator